MNGPAIVHDVTLWATDRPDRPVTAQLSYTPDDPYAARLAFLADGRETVAYTFGRDLLEEGMWGPAGVGDVTVTPHDVHEPFLVITVTPEAGYPIAFYAARVEIADFIDAMYRLVPLGREAERIDWDANLAALLGGAA